jgi:hypothetical protein
MRDHNLGPATTWLLREYARAGRTQDPQGQKEEIISVAGEMAKLLAKWYEEGWCQVDAAPARICGGPHVNVRYPDLDTDVIEPLSKMGETFNGAKFIRLTPTATG